MHKINYSKYVQRIICNKILKKILVCHLKGKKGAFGRSLEIWKDCFVIFDVILTVRRH